MAPTEPRPLLVRVIEYRDSLRSQADQIEEIAHATGNPAHLTDAIRLFRIIATDLDHLVDGQELAPWMITAQMPPQ